MATLTYLDVINRIAARLGRDDLDPDPQGVTIIRDTITDLIDYYKSECFADGQVRNETITTIPGEAVYQLPAGCEEVESVSYLSGSVWNALSRESFDYINSQDYNQPSIRLGPLYWCQRADYLLFGPGAPDGAYLLQIAGNIPSGPPAADHLSNFWTADGHMLVVNGACAEIAETYLNDPVRAGRYRNIEQRELARLQAKTIRAHGHIQIVPW